MEKLFKNSKRWMSAFGVVAFLMVAGWQVGADGTNDVFTETEVALENAVAGSGSGPTLKKSYCSSHKTYYECKYRTEGEDCPLNGPTSCY